MFLSSTGGIFRGSAEDPSMKEKAFRFAIDHMNKVKRKPKGERLLAPEIRYLDTPDTYEAMRRGK